MGRFSTSPRKEIKMEKEEETREEARGRNIKGVRVGRREMEEKEERIRALSHSQRLTSINLVQPSFFYFQVLST